jgi:hypothetical protein
MGSLVTIAVLILHLAGGAIAVLPKASRLQVVHRETSGGAHGMIETLKRRNIGLVIAHFCGSKDYRRMLASVRRDHDVPVLSLPSLFPEVRGWPEFVARFGLGWNSHPNAEAHRRFAEGLAEVVETSYRPLAGP